MFLGDKSFNDDALEYLMELGCDIGKKSFYGNNLLYEVLSNKSLKKSTLETILKFKPNMNELINGRSPFMMLCKYNPNLEFIKLCVKSGADPKLLDKDGRNSLKYLFLSQEFFNYHVVLYFIYLRCDIGQQDIYGNNVLHQIILCKALTKQKLDLLLLFKPNIIDEVNKNGNSPFTLLCKYNPKIELIKLFVEYGADLKFLGKDEKNLLRYMFSNKKYFHYDVVKYLMKLGCDIKKDILHQIIMKQVLTKQKLKMLLKFKPDIINEKDIDGNSPLMTLCRYYPKIEFVKLFIKSGANVNAVNHQNENCLFHLLCNKDFDYNIIEYLVRKGCNINQVNSNGETFFDFYIHNTTNNKITLKTLNLLANLNAKLNYDGNNYTVYFNFKNSVKFSKIQLFY